MSANFWSSCKTSDLEVIVVDKYVGTALDRYEEILQIHFFGTATELRHKTNTAENIKIRRKYFDIVSTKQTVTLLVLFNYSPR